jgi:long-chain acyl-CoA synthetase
VWPEPDLPRTSTGKVRRKVVAEWVANRAENAISGNGTGRLQQARADWLYALVAEIAGEHPEGGDDLRLSEDFHLDSLGRVQLASALEERMADGPNAGSVDAARTVGDLRELVASRAAVLGTRSLDTPEPTSPGNREGSNSQRQTTSVNIPRADDELSDQSSGEPVATRKLDVAPQKPEFTYPRWPWWRPMQWIRSGFLELIAQPLVWLLGNPRVVRQCELQSNQPMLIICNHVTAYDGALVEYALPGHIRRRIATAMSGEMLGDFRHFRDPDTGKFMLFGPGAYWLLTALYNVFPLPRRRDFQRSFAHAGEALDRGYNVMVFPEGTRSPAGELAPFRPGIGMLVKQAHAPVLPVALIGLGELKAQGRGWFRSGKLEVQVGEAMQFGSLETEAAITQKLHAAVSSLLQTVR